MTKTIKSISLLFLSLFLASCDCFQRANGVIIDKKSRQLMSKVKIDNQQRSGLLGNDSLNNYSGSSRHFDIHYITGGVFKCPDLELTFLKKGYITNKITLKNSTSNETVYLEKVK